ncbi:hypothetical protein ES703_72891 [subsurface metagenome]
MSFIRIRFYPHKKFGCAHQKGSDIKRASGNSKFNKMPLLVYCVFIMQKAFQYKGKQSLFLYARLNKLFRLVKVMNNFFGIGKTLLTPDGFTAECRWLRTHSIFRPQSGQKHYVWESLYCLEIRLKPNIVTGVIIQGGYSIPARQPGTIYYEPYW